MAGPGRPTTYTEELADRICNAIAGDKSLRRICTADDMPGRRTVEGWLALYPEFRAKYARARDLQADAIVDDVKRTEVKLERGRIAHEAARVLIASKQWRAAKVAPKKYGDRLTVAGDKANPVHVAHSVDLSDEDLARIARAAPGG